MGSLGPIKGRIIEKLTKGLMPTRLVVKDVSHLHAHHKQSPGLPETHFDLTVVSESFGGINLLKRHRMVYGLLSEELAERVHALSMKTITPQEDSGGNDSRSARSSQASEGSGPR